jgi:hypothetical protein
MIISRWAALCCLLFPPYLSPGQTPEVLGLQASYQKGETITFVVKNNSDSVLTVSSFVLEKYAPEFKSWYEQAYDLLAINCQEESGKQVLTIAPNASRTISWNPRQVYPTCFDYKRNSGSYRLVFLYHRRAKDRGRYYMQEFRIGK